MSSDDTYLKKANENNGILKKLNVDIDSWQGAQKIELQLKLKECTYFLKECNASSVNNIIVPFAKTFMDKIDAFEWETDSNIKVGAARKLLNRVEDLRKETKRSLNYNRKVLSGAKLSHLTDTLQNISLDSSNNTHLVENEYPTLAYERINGLLDKIEEQEKEIERLTSLLPTQN